MHHGGGHLIHSPLFRLSPILVSVSVFCPSISHSLPFSLLSLLSQSGEVSAFCPSINFASWLLIITQLAQLQSPATAQWPANAVDTSTPSQLAYLASAVAASVIVPPSPHTLNWAAGGRGRGVVNSAWTAEAMVLQLAPQLCLGMQVWMALPYFRSHHKWTLAAEVKATFLFLGGMYTPSFFQISDFFCKTKGILSSFLENLPSLYTAPIN